MDLRFHFSSISKQKNKIYLLQIQFNNSNKIYTFIVPRTIKILLKILILMCVMMKQIFGPSQNRLREPWWPDCIMVTSLTNAGLNPVKALGNPNLSPQRESQMPTQVTTAEDDMKSWMTIIIPDQSPCTVAYQNNIINVLQHTRTKSFKCYRISGLYNRYIVVFWDNVDAL